MDVADKHITVMGLGHHGGGVAVARYLARLGAVVTVTDLADADVLAHSLKQLRNVPIARFRLGGHSEQDFRQADIVVANPAVRDDNRLLRLARAAGAWITTEIDLFLRACPAKVIGVTGSVGKSTTAAMTAAILRAAGLRCWLGGNIGGSLLSELPTITVDDWVVLELSSFQLARLQGRAGRVEVVIVTGCEPHHLDWHGSYQHYVASKQRIFSLQNGQSAAVLNSHDPEVAAWGHLVHGQQLAPAPRHDIPPLRTAGQHNRQNAALAAAAARAAGCGPAAIESGLSSFQGLPHRLQLVRQAEGRRMLNDSMATMPASTVAALNALSGRTWLLAGGYEQGEDFRLLAGTIARQALGVALYGGTRARLGRLVRAHAPDLPMVQVETLREAFAWCLEWSGPGEDILLSPAAASHDQFRDYAERGAAFVDLVHNGSLWFSPGRPRRAGRFHRVAAAAKPDSLDLI